MLVSVLFFLIFSLLFTDNIYASKIQNNFKEDLYATNLDATDYNTEEYFKSLSLAFSPRKSPRSSKSVSPRFSEKDLLSINENSKGLSEIISSASIQDMYLSNDLIGEDDENELSDNDSQVPSFVNESYLEELGLLLSRNSTPVLHSPSRNFKRIANGPPFALLRKKFDAEDNESSCSSSSFDSCSDVVYDEELVTFDTSKDFTSPMNTVFEDINDNVSSIIETEPLSRIINATPTSISSLNTEILSIIIEYCGDHTLLNARLISKAFNESCLNYLRFLSFLTLGADEVPFSTFFDRYALSSTMMPFYRTQPAIQDIINAYLPSSNQLQQYNIPWKTDSIFKVSTIKDFVNLAVFSDEFISTVLIPNLSSLLVNPANDHAPLFLLGETLIRSGRISLFENYLLPMLNFVSVRILDQLIVPENNLLSPGFIDFQENQKVLGATFHVLIDLNLNLSIKHLIRMDPNIIGLKDHFGKTALMKIVENLWRWRVTLPNPKLNINDWLNITLERFINGLPVQPEFPGNSRLSVQTFLLIMNQISGQNFTPEETVSFLGFNNIFMILSFLRGNTFALRKTTLIHELVSAQQYDLLFSIGFHYGHLIRNELKLNCPLHHAIEMNNSILTGILMRFFTNYNVNQLTSSGSSTVSLAINGNSLDTLEILLNDPRVDPNLHSKQNPLIQSIELSRFEAFSLLLKHPNINIHIQIPGHSELVSPLERVITLRKWDFLESLLNFSNHGYEKDCSALRLLKVAEVCLTKSKSILLLNRNELLNLISRILLPPIQEDNCDK